MGLFDRFRGRGGRGAEDAERAGATERRARGAEKAERAERTRRLRKVTKIEREVLDLVCESAKSSHPHEFGAVLRAEGDTIIEILVVPTIQGDAHAIMYLGQLPIDASACGTVHSHPSPVPLPSYADQELFRSFGHTHIIVAHPYNLRTWRAYDQDSRDIRLEVV